MAPETLGVQTARHARAELAIDGPRNVSRVRLGGDSGRLSDPPPLRRRAPRSTLLELPLPPPPCPRSAASANLPLTLDGAIRVAIAQRLFGRRALAGGSSHHALGDALEDGGRAEAVEPAVGGREAPEEEHVQPAARAPEVLHQQRLYHSRLSAGRGDTGQSALGMGGRPARRILQEYPCTLVVRWRTARAACACRLTTPPARSAPPTQCPCAGPAPDAAGCIQS